MALQQTTRTLQQQAGTLQHSQFTRPTATSSASQSKLNLLKQGANWRKSAVPGILIEGTIYLVITSNNKRRIGRRTYSISSERQSEAYEELITIDLCNQSATGIDTRYYETAREFIRTQGIQPEQVTQAQQRAINTKQQAINTETTPPWD